MDDNKRDINDITDAMYALVYMDKNIVIIQDRVFVFQSFYPASRSTEHTELVGKDITRLIQSQFVGFTPSSIGQLEAQGNIDSQIDKIPSIRKQYHKDVKWEQYLKVK